MRGGEEEEGNDGGTISGSFTKGRGHQPTCQRERPATTIPEPRIVDGERSTLTMATTFLPAATGRRAAAGRSLRGRRAETPTLIDLEVQDRGGPRCRSHGSSRSQRSVVGTTAAVQHLVWQKQQKKQQQKKQQKKQQRSIPSRRWWKAAAPNSCCCALHQMWRNIRLRLTFWLREPGKGGGQGRPGAPASELSLEEVFPQCYSQGPMPALRLRGDAILRLPSFRLHSTASPATKAICSTYNCSCCCCCCWWWWRCFL